MREAISFLALLSLHDPESGFMIYRVNLRGASLSLAKIQSEDSKLGRAQLSSAIPEAPLPMIPICSLRLCWTFLIGLMDRLVWTPLYVWKCILKCITILDTDLYSLIYAFAIDFVIRFEELLELFDIFLQVVEGCVVVFSIQTKTIGYAWKWCRVF